MGAPECPCLSNESAIGQKVAAHWQTISRPLDYGLRGCAKYDIGVAELDTICADAEGKEGDPKYLHCFRPWCYVDKELCEENRSKCERIGSLDSPYCRDRPKELSSKMDDLYFSYETCGRMRDGGQAGKLNFRHMVNRVVLVTPLYMRAEVQQTADGNWTGAMFELLKHGVQNFPGAALQVANLSQGSMAASEGNMFTACVHDVALQRIDVCVAPIWLTPERLKFSNFLPSLYEDPMSFVVKDDYHEITMAESMEQAFRPFTPSLWASVVLFLIVAGLSLLCADHSFNEDDFPPEETMWRKLCRSVYFGLIAFCSGGPAHTPVTWPARMITLGLSFFVLIGVGSYTANLASFLVNQSLQTKVSSFTEAVNAGYRICVPAVIEPQVMKTYPAVRPQKVRVATYDWDCPGILARGEVDAMLLSRESMDMLQAGFFVDYDCKPGKPYVNDPLTCPRDNEGKLKNDRDCRTSVVGPPPLTLSTSFPVSDEMMKPMSWAISHGTGEGKYKALQDEFWEDSWMVRKVCSEKETESKSLDYRSIFGTSVISSFLVITGLIWALLKVFGFCLPAQPSTPATPEGNAAR